MRARPTPGPGASTEIPDVAAERLQKLLARAGVASRRAAELLVSAGRVRVNGRVVTELGSKADAKRDKVEVDGKRVLTERHVYVLLHKPRGVVTTLSDPEGRETIASMLADVPGRVYPVGRLDFHTSGALLVTNDGGLTQALLHPAQKVPKTYVVKLAGHVGEEAIEKLAKGVALDDGYVTAPAMVTLLREEPTSTWLEVTIHEGKNRQIHRMAEAVGHRVMRLARVSFAGIDTEGLQPGRWRELDEKEIAELKKKYMGITPQVRTGGAHRAPDRRKPRDGGVAADRRTPRARPARDGERKRPERGARAGKPPSR